MHLLMLGLMIAQSTPPAPPPIATPATPSRKVPDAGFAAAEKVLVAAIEGGSFVKTAEAYEKLDAAYRLPRSTTDHFPKFCALAKTPDENRTLARLAMDLADNLHESFEVSAASAVLEATLKSAVNTDAATRANLQLLRQRMVDLNFQTPWIKAKDAWQTLQTKPSDADAKLTVAGYRCFEQNHWPAGLMLARELPDGKDDDFRKVAAMELTKALPFQLGDAWRDWALLQDERRKAAGMRRARMWYARQIEDSSVAIDGYNRAKKTSIFTLGNVDSECIPGLVEDVIIKHRKTVTRSWDVTGFKLYGGTKADLMLETVWSGRLIPPTNGRYHIFIDGDANASTFKFALDAKGDPVLDPRVTPQTLGTFDHGKTTQPMMVSLILPGETPVPFEITFKLPATAQAKARLKWIRPGSTTPELIPSECVYYKP